jgi:hypothetical protein
MWRGRILWDAKIITNMLSCFRLSCRDRMERMDSLLGGPLGRADIQMWHKPLTTVHNLFALETDLQNVTACSKKMNF